MNELLSPAFGHKIICGGHDDRITEAAARRTARRNRLLVDELGRSEHH
ncbi:MAG: hypothetical protein ACR2O6_10405 [Ilumatobacteraceae bacterium]